MFCLKNKKFFSIIILLFLVFCLTIPQVLAFDNSTSKDSVCIADSENLSTGDCANTEISASYNDN